MAFPKDSTSRNADFAAAIDADQVELQAMRFGRASMEEGLRDDALFQGAGPYGDSGIIGRRLGLEEKAGRICDEVRRRQQILGKIYPFSMEDPRTLQYVPDCNDIYEFCLAVTMSASLSDHENKGLPVLLEKLCLEVAMAWMGKGARSIRTGWPRETGLPTRGKSLFKKVESLTGEWHWQPARGRPPDPSVTVFRDGGIDGIVWKSWPDGRTGALFLALQCACGLSDWEEKANDLKKLEEWVRLPFADAGWLGGMGLPFHLPNLSHLREISRKAGIILDRTRMSFFTDSLSPKLRKQLKEISARARAPGFNTRTIKSRTRKARSR